MNQRTFLRHASSVRQNLPTLLGKPGVENISLSSSGGEGRGEEAPFNPHPSFPLFPSVNHSHFVSLVPFVALPVNPLPLLLHTPSLRKNLPTLQGKPGVENISLSSSGGEGWGEEASFRPHSSFP